ncbi:MAG TPA: imelysin family protein [Chitinophagales bacterium]|nr:imelysin family protein [Chitinophagales bacterium]
MRILKIALPVLILLAAQGCVEKNKDNFDRTAMLSNLGNSIIAPAYTTLAANTLALQNQANTFIAAPGVASLDSLKQSYINAYVKYQAVEIYDFTPSQYMRNSFNSFPADTNQINNNIVTGVYDLSTANNVQAKGFPALDYLLYSKTAAEVVALFATDVNAAKRKQYLADIVSELNTKAAAASAGWSGDYLNTFIQASGTDVGSSTGMLVNDLSMELERNRRERVGNSLGYVGIVSGGAISPYSLEAFYAAYSKELLIENLQQMKILYQGGTGTGFDDYLNQIGADYNGTPLATEITNQFDKTILAAQNIPVDFATALTTNKPQMETLFLEIKRLVVLVKVDMSSNLGVVINYADNDGD